MDNIRQKSWFSIAAYLVSSLSILMILLYFAETYFPNSPSSITPRSPDAAMDKRRLFSPAHGQYSRKAAASGTSQQEILIIPLNRKRSAGQTELVYRGLVGRSEFRIDVIIPALDPQVSYPHRIKISEAKESFRLTNRNYKLLSANKTALRLKQIK
jgi:hypothetical protein